MLSTARPEPNMCSQKCGNGCAGALASTAMVSRVCAASGVAASVRMMTTRVRAALTAACPRLRPQSLSGCEPAARESGALQPLAQVRIRAHHPPDEIAAVVLDHGEDRPLVDTDIVSVDPARVPLPRAVRHRIRNVCRRRLYRRRRDYRV